MLLHKNPYFGNCLSNRSFNRTRSTTRASTLSWVWGADKEDDDNDDDDDDDDDDRRVGESLILLDLLMLLLDKVMVDFSTTILRASLLFFGFGLDQAVRWREVYQRRRTNSFGARTVDNCARRLHRFSPRQEIRLAANKN